MRQFIPATLAPLLAAAIFLPGCETADETSGSQWLTKHPAEAQSAAVPPQAGGPVETPAQEPSGGQKPASASEQKPAAGNDEQKPAAEPGSGDAVSFSSLRWSYGGIDGSGARKSSASIGGLRFTRDSLSYSWTGPTLSSWGLANSNPGAYACLFVQKSDGSWVGGKFDWISTSRTSRHLENVFGHYNGWSFSGVPNPCNAAFVIVSADRKKRTNVISGRWAR